MARARFAAHVAFVLVICSFGVVSAVGSTSAPAASGAAAALADVPWPPSHLLVAEVVTGGASASDEYLELTNAGAASVDLVGLEVAYVTSSGSTVTRKATWTATTILEPGRHLLIANALGVHAAAADATYSGGFAATGGALVLRPVGGAPVDAVGWGDATNAFVEGTVAPAPAANSSIERRPGGASGNLQDTNSNAVDFLVNASPIAQNLAAPPVPEASPTPQPTPSVSPSPSATPAPSPSPSVEPTTSPSASPAPTPSPTPTLTPEPTPSATATPSVTPEPTAPPTPTPTVTPEPTAPPTPAPTVTPEATVEPTPEPTASPTPTPTPTATPAPTPPPTATPTPPPSPTATPSPSATPTPQPSPTPSPSPSVPATTAIADARRLADGSAVTISGVVTVALGSLESGRGGFVQDDSAGIALYLDAAVTVPVAAGTRIRATGTLDQRYFQRTLRVSSASVETLGEADLPRSAATATGLAGEEQEGLRIAVTGVMTGSASQLADGVAVTIDDGTGSLRLVLAPAVLPPSGPAAGDMVSAEGTLGQRDSTGTGTSAYRLHVTIPGELAVAAPPPSPTPLPTATPSPSASPSPTPTPSPSPSPSPSASPTASPTPTVASYTVAEARQRAVGGRLTVRGVVVAEAGRMGTPPLFVIADPVAGLPVRLAEGQLAPPRGTLVIVIGQLADPYGQLELRLASGGLATDGPGDLPQPLATTGGDLGEEHEGRLVTIEGTVDGRPQRATSGDITLVLRAPDGREHRVYADASADLAAGEFSVGARYRLTGVVGQRASRKGALDGYRVWLRDAADVALLAPPPPSSSSTTSASTPRPSATPRVNGATTQPTAAQSPGPTLAIAEARIAREGVVTVQGIVTIAATLLDASARRIVVEDATGAIEVYLARAEATVVPGRTVRVTGEAGRAYGAPRLRARTIELVGTGSMSSRLLTSAPGAAHEWRLVRVSGRVTDVTRSGARWRAELEIRGERIPISGLTGSSIPSTALVEGRAATITGIVRRPYPNATDRRFAIVPRTAADIVLGPASGAAGSSRNAAAAVAESPSREQREGSAPNSPDLAPAQGVTDIDLRDAAGNLGARVRVGGLVVDLLPDGFTLDDGTAVGVVRLTGAAAVHLPLLEPRDAVNVIGAPERDEEGIVIVVDDPAGLTRVPALGERADLDASLSDELLSDGQPGDPSPDTATAVSAPLAGVGGLPGAGLGLGSLVILGAASVGVHALRRDHARRLGTARVRARLERLAGPAEPPPPPEQDRTAGGALGPNGGHAGGRRDWPS